MQLYTGMVYQGPNIVSKIKKDIKKINENDISENLMTSNSDLDLVFIFPDKNQNFQNQKTYHLILSLISQKMISILSSKTSENLIYEFDFIYHLSSILQIKLFCGLISI